MLNRGSVSAASLFVITSLQGPLLWLDLPCLLTAAHSVSNPVNQTMPIFRQHRATSYFDDLGTLPEASIARELPALGRDMLAPEVCSECMVLVRQTVSTQIVLTFFSYMPI